MIAAEEAHACCHHRPSPRVQGHLKGKSGDTTCGPVCMPRSDGEGDMAWQKARLQIAVGQ